MVLSMPSRRTATITHMGGEGANWIGQAPFTKEPHVFQNLGDGTYTHSGLLAIRAAAAAGVNITYKILYNDAVAMTGGQRADAGLSVGQVAHQVVAEGAKRVAVVTDEPDKYTVGTFPASVSIHHRDELDAVQRTLREISGLTVLIYDQTCAAEKRRRRKRGLLPDPPKHMFINELVCEGCGDCSQKSNCISVRPVETDFGRKRQIDQSNCNKDYACVGGFCPSFVTVEGGSLRKQQEAEVGTPVAMTTELLETVPLPRQGPLVRPYGILIAGIGGTGVITLGALLGMAAHLEGKGCTVLDFTGLAQKNGAVTSHVRLAPKPEDLSAVRIGPGGADLLLGCDMVVAASRPAITRIQEGLSHALINDYVQPTAGFIGNPDLDFKGNAMREALRAAVGNDRIDFLNATELATSLMGNSIAANLFLLGYAFQKGLIPLSLEAIQRAIELNGTGADSNRRAFGWGRLAVHDPASVQQAAGPLRPENVRPTLNHLIDSRAAFLTKYQDAALATQYLDAVARVRTAEESNTPGLTRLTEAVAINLFKLMAYKDEYEVARLYTDGSFEKELRRQFVGPYKLTFHLAPPLFARRDPTSGHLKKSAYGPWMWHAFRVLAGLRRLRGTAFDPFGYTAERRGERRILAEYEATLNELADRLTPSNHPVALALAEVPAQIRGYGHIKEANLIAAKAKWADLLQKLREPEILSRAAE
jgi:indolepyruvate ferredoxin oxidoreductase